MKLEGLALQMTTSLYNCITFPPQQNKQRTMFMRKLASVAFLAAFCFGRVGGSANTIDVCGRTIGGAKSVTISLGCRGGARTIVFFVAVGKRTGVLWKHLKELTALKSSAALLCLIFLFPSNFRLASLAF